MYGIIEPSCTTEVRPNQLYRKDTFTLGSPRVSFILSLSQFTFFSYIDNLGNCPAFQTSVICKRKKHLTRIITGFLMLQEINWFYILNCCTHATPPTSNAHNYEFLYFKMVHMHKSFHSGPKFHLHDLA